MITAGAVAQRLQKTAAAQLHRKPARQLAPGPMVSFTFDDFPRSAVHAAGRMLSDYGVRGTYYAALGLMGTTTVVGEMFQRSDLETLVTDGHEVACHTFSHVLTSQVTTAELLENCRENSHQMADILNGYGFENFSFPEGVITVAAKRALSSVYETCRTIEPGVNRDPVDLAFLRANRVYSRWGTGQPKELIAESCRENGWTILYTHDVCDNPSLYGCTPQEFREVLECAMRSGAEVLPICEARQRFTGQKRVCRDLQGKVYV